MLSALLSYLKKILRELIIYYYKLLEQIQSSKMQKMVNTGHILNNEIQHSMTEALSIDGNVKDVC
jgi:hypothetical protein